MNSGHDHSAHDHSAHDHSAHDHSVKRHAGHSHHGRGSGHAHGGIRREGSFRRLTWTLVLIVVYMLAEVVGGWLTHSLALLADAGHMISDAAALGLSLFAMWIARRPPTPQKTYGYYRAEILAALVNGATLVAIALFIFVEAYQRFRNPPQVLGAWMMVVAVGGLIVNVGALLILHGARGESLNVRAAWLHVMGDAAGSVGAILAGIFIWTLGWNWADPVASVLIGLLILISSWRLLKETVEVLMEHAPARLDVDEVHAAIMGIEGVAAIHDLHVWTITSGLDALSAHVNVREPLPAAELLARIRSELHERFAIDHVTLQLEPEVFGGCRPQV
ncbi:MAG TPA: cation diffusion facilitator family transporter [Phycisphaerae bacterium]|nr:cation diffusion facilitator family transporter [Phycisphaerae bacterium]